MANASALQVVRTYYDFVWSGKDVDRINDLCAESMLRHDPQGDVTMTRAEQRERILRALPMGLRFEFLVALEDRNLASVVWQAKSETSTKKIAGIQTFRIEDGKIAEVWNAMVDRMWIDG